jgi:5'-nucleotidase
VSDAFILGVDLDGVCGDYTAAFRAVVAAERGIDPTTLPDARDWSFREWGLTADEFDRLHRVAVLEHHMFRTMPAVPGVAEALWQLSDMGVWIRLITHRLYVSWGHAVAVADTVGWLDDVGIPYRDLCFLGHKPQVEADAYIDDAPHNVLALRERGNTVIVFDQPYNRDVDGPRAADWSTVASMVVDLVAVRRPVQGPLPGLAAAADRLGRARRAPTRERTRHEPADQVGMGCRAATPDGIGDGAIWSTGSRRTRGDSPSSSPTSRTRAVTASWRSACSSHCWPPSA